MTPPSDDHHPLFTATCNYLKKTFFYKDVERLVTEIPIDLHLAERLCQYAFVVCDNNYDTYYKKLNSLLEMNMLFLTLQAKLEKERRYLYSTFKEVNDNVFLPQKDTEKHLFGVDYLWGLYFSQIFWVTHQRVFQFFLSEFVTSPGASGRCLDVPSGSAMFLAEFLRENSEWSGQAFDLSDTALHQSQSMIAAYGLSGRATASKQDFFLIKSGETFDRIICTEFLEHVEDPLLVLTQLKKLLSQNGKIFLTTVVWAAFIDHIYLYRNVSEIRNHLKKSGFRIEKELIQPIFEKDKGKEEESDIALNYAVLLAHN